jgi:predicted metal-dependent HD superfamily phosphohydrolase
MSDVLRRKWRDLLGAWAVERALADRTFEEIRGHYAEPGRFYHTLDHVHDVLDTVEFLGTSALNLNAVRLAAWLHDVIYDSRATDNEERSADYAERLCRELSVPEGRVVAALILKTKGHDAGHDPDAQVLLDADLAVLGADESAYRKYAEQIRLEYAWVPEADYRAARRQVLTNFLTRPRIYHFLSDLEEPARRNIAAEIARLARVQLTLLPVDGTFAVCRLAGAAPIPPWATASPFLSITRTANELSVVCRQDAVPEGVVCERGWHCVRVAGTMPFTVVGVLASLTAPLADAGVSVFAVSTFDTDYLLVKSDDLARAVDALRRHGHTVHDP